VTSSGKAGSPSNTTHVDPGALAVAVILGGTAFIIGSGTWNLLAVVVGLFLLIILLAYWRPAPSVSTVRDFATKLGFGAGTALAICIAIAPGVEWGIFRLFFHSAAQCINGYFTPPPDPYCNGTYVDGNDSDALKATYTIAGLWFPLLAILTALEPRIMRLLDRPWRNAT
jgi:hypothetical protein